MSSAMLAHSCAWFTQREGAPATTMYTCRRTSPPVCQRAVRSHTHTCGCEGGAHLSHRLHLVHVVLVNELVKGRIDAVQDGDLRAGG